MEIHYHRNELLVNSAQNCNIASRSPLQQPRQLHQLFKPGAPFVWVGNQSFAVADFVGAAGGELAVGGPAVLAVGNLVGFLRDDEIANPSFEIGRFVDF